MAIYDTSSTIDSSVFLKARLSKNMVGSNYYIENLQSKRDQDWEYRYNVVKIEEELSKQVDYHGTKFTYTPVEAVINHVRLDTGEDLATDWVRLKFRDLKHPTGLGYRYRFSYDFPDMETMTEDDKHYETSVWLGVNIDKISPGNSCIVRRCNTALPFLGSPSLDDKNVTEVHYEPCVLENEMKYMQVYYNQAVPVPQSEWYATMQLNYYTNFIKLNDRFLFGTVDQENRANNPAYKVKAIIKSTTQKTFVRDSKEELEVTPLITIALDRDNVADGDNWDTRVAVDAPIYRVVEEDPTYEYYIHMDDSCVQRIILGDSQEYTVSLRYNNIEVDSEFDFEYTLEGIDEDTWDNYFEFSQTGPNTFKVKNLRTCNRSPLRVMVSCVDPADPNVTLEESYEIELGGFY